MWADLNLSEEDVKSMGLKCKVARRIIEGTPDYIHVKWSERTLCNKILRLFYRLIKGLYVSMWFYFVPFLAIFLSYYLPYLNRNKEFIDEDECF